MQRIFCLIIVLCFTQCGGHKVPRQEIRRIQTVGTPIQGVGEFTFTPDNLLDGNLHTSWQTSSPGAASVLVEFEKPIDIKTLRIANGFQWTDHPTFGNLLEKNSRVATIAIAMQLSGSDGSAPMVTKDLNLRDRTQPGWDEIEIDQNRVVTISFRPVSIYSGSQWKDLAISEIEFIAK